MQIDLYFRKKSKAVVKARRKNEDAQGADGAGSGVEKAVVKVQREDDDSMPWYEVCLGSLMGIVATDILLSRNGKEAGDFEKFVGGMIGIELFKRGRK
jgi:hypothetical protein